jgi:hypothetical protein
VHPMFDPTGRLVDYDGKDLRIDSLLAGVGFF